MDAWQRIEAAEARVARMREDVRKAGRGRSNKHREEIARTAKYAADLALAIEVARDIASAGGSVERVAAMLLSVLD